MIDILRTKDPAFDLYLEKIKTRIDDVPAEITDAVKKIIDDVRSRGDSALVEYTERFDDLKISPEEIEVTPEEIRKSSKRLSAEDREILNIAADRICTFHKRQVTKGFTFKDEYGNLLGQISRPLERVGIYVPGGRTSYPSTLLMNAIPAKVAGVEEIIATHPTPRGELSPAVMAAAEISGIKRIFRVGGAQAIAALAFGTETIPAVDKVAGPGNIYVATAKRLLYGKIDIDIIAGPSEILIISDGTTDPKFSAADLLSQAEHDPLSAVILITTDPKFAEAVKGEIEKQLLDLDRTDTAEESIKNFGAIIISKDLRDAISIANEIAPEHLELQVKDPHKILGDVKNAGAVFLGKNSPEAIGDYVAGPNHVLPTGGSARFSSPLGVYDFVKRMNLIEMTDKGLKSIGPLARDFATIEGLLAHANAVEIRLKKKK